MFEQLGLIGCGLIGGSLALAARRAGAVRRIVGWSGSVEATAEALRLGVIDVAARSAQAAAAASDLVVIAVPVAATESVFRDIRDHLEPDALLMDVGSTKRDVVDAARRALRERVGCFVPAHPIAGKEAAGVAHAEATLFDLRRVVLTPISETPDALATRAEALWTAMGGLVERMSPENHDAAFAAVSHLPHLLAFAYLNAIVGQPAGADFLRLAGPGFRDFTRIAASDPAVWRDILSSNREELLRQSLRFRQALDTLEHVIRVENGDALESFIRSASASRAGWQMPSAPTR